MRLVLSIEAFRELTLVSWDEGVVGAEPIDFDSVHFAEVFIRRFVHDPPSDGKFTTPVTEHHSMYSVDEPPPSRLTPSTIPTSTIRSANAGSDRPEADEERPSTTTPAKRPSSSLAAAGSCSASRSPTGLDRPRVTEVVRQPDGRPTPRRRPSTDERHERRGTACAHGRASCPASSSSGVPPPTCSTRWCGRASPCSAGRSRPWAGPCRGTS